MDFDTNRLGNGVSADLSRGKAHSMSSFIDQLRRLLFGKSRPTSDQDSATAPPPSPIPFLTQAVGEPAKHTALDDPRAYMDKVTAKIDRLAADFASGAINRAQFQELFEHYQKERRTIQRWIRTNKDAEGWRQAAKEGHSIVIRDRHTARVLGYAIYENESGMPITTIGQFDVDPALAVPMLSAYRTAAREIFGGELRSTQIEGGKWLTFIPGQFTTLLSVFTTEPAANQLEDLEELHAIFERANNNTLKQRKMDPSGLVLPHHSFLGRTS